MTRYILSFLAGLCVTFLVVFFIKLSRSAVQRFDLLVLTSTFLLLILFFGYYVSGRISSGQKQKN